MMPINFLPWVILALLIGVPLFFRLAGRRAFRRAVAVSVSLVLILFGWVYGRGLVLMLEANRGDPEAMYELARWTENHDEQIGRFVPWPVVPDVLGGYAWLEKAADLDYPPALYAVGVRLKYGEHVPRPPGWTASEGNYFPQPERGQVLIDKAVRLGYKPSTEESSFYWREYRR
jgi:TPR repeat protein